jgi:hypothetical protein
VAEDLEYDGLVRLGASAHLAQRYAQEGREFVAHLVAMLETALPEATQVERRGGLFEAKTLSRLVVHLANYIYALEIPTRGSLVPWRTKVVRGIKLKTERLTMEDWLDELGEHLTAYARDNRQASEALQELLGGAG